MITHCHPSNSQRFKAILAIALLFWVASPPCRAEETRVVSVSARSELRVTPDEALIAFSVATKHIKLATAKKENDTITSALVTAIRAQDVGNDDLKVTDLDIGPDYDKDGDLEGYDVKRSFEIRTRDFSKIDPIIGDIVEVGGDTIRIRKLQLGVRDQRKHQVEARRLAVEYAREKASHLADLNNMKIGDALSIHESVEYGGGGGFGGAMGGGGMSLIEQSKESPVAKSNKLSAPATRPRVQLVSLQNNTKAQTKQPKAAEAANQDVLLSPGQVSLNATVSIRFELLPK